MAEHNKKNNQKENDNVPLRKYIKIECVFLICLNSHILSFSSVKINELCKNDTFFLT